MDYRKFLELCQRGQTGQKVEKSDWDLDYVIDTVMELNEEYDFSWDKQVIIPEDEQLFKDINHFLANGTDFIGYLFNHTADTINESRH